MSSGAFVPQFGFISAIQLGLQTVVTFTAPIDFTVGEIVSFRVSPVSGTFELNNQQTQVLSVTSNTITVPINSTNFTPYISLPTYGIAFPALVVPVGSGILPNTRPAQTSLFDVFDNVPPD
jgi:hypothetical protein